MKKQSDTSIVREVAVMFGYTNNLIFNDKRKGQRRIKIWSGDFILNKPKHKRVAFVQELLNKFGDRLVSVQPLYGSYAWSHDSVVIRLTA